MTGGEGGDEEVDLSIVRLVVLGIAVDHFQGLWVADPHRVNVVGGIGDEMEEMRRRGDDLGGGFAQVLAEFAPERVEHEFGRAFPARVFGDQHHVEVHVLPFAVGLDVLPFLRRGLGPTRIANRFLLDLQPRVHVLGEESRPML